MTKHSNKASILNRIKSLERDIVNAREYLENGEHAHWHGFRPQFKEKKKKGQVLQPHKSWIRNVFLPGCEQELRKAEKLLDSIQ